MRVKRGTTAHARHHKVIKQAKGMKHNSATRSYRLARERVVKSLQYAFRDRRNRKRDMRSLWITRINAAARQNGTTYARLMDGLKKHNINLDRKTLADLAAREPEAFATIVKAAMNK